MKLTIQLEKVVDGEYHIKVSRPTGTLERKVLSKKALDEYLEQAENYCSHKGYQLIKKGF